MRGDAHNWFFRFLLWRRLISNGAKYSHSRIPFSCLARTLARKRVGMTPSIELFVARSLSASGINEFRQRTRIYCLDLSPLEKRGRGGLESGWIDGIHSSAEIRKQQQRKKPRKMSPPRSTRNFRWTRLEQKTWRSQSTPKTRLTLDNTKYSLATLSIFRNE